MLSLGELLGEMREAVKNDDELRRYLLEKYRIAYSIYVDELNRVAELCCKPELEFVDDVVPWDITIDYESKKILVSLKRVKWFLERNIYICKNGCRKGLLTLFWEPVTAFIHELLEYALLVCTNGSSHKNKTVIYMAHVIARTIENYYRWKLYKLEPFPL